MHCAACKDHGMRGERIDVIWNPSKVERADLESAIFDAMADASDTDAGQPNADVHWWETDEVKRALGDDPAERGLVLVAGGDGTVREVAEYAGRIGSNRELGLVPLGTGNLLARNLGVPLGLQPAIAHALSTPARPLDLGWVDVERAGASLPERFAFTVMAGFGIDAQMIAETDDDLKSKVGWLAYVESLGRAVSGSDVVDFALTLDGGDEQRDRAHTLVIGNCGTLQGGLTILPDADPRDGILDMLVVRAEGVAAWLETLRTVALEHDAASAEALDREQFQELTVELPTPLLFEVDGDEIGEVTGFRVEIQPSAFRVRA